MPSEATHIVTQNPAPPNPHAPSPHAPTINISADASSFLPDWRELWAYRELLYILVWRDIKVRYKQTLMGAAWVVLQPLLTMLLFTFIFTRLRSLPAGDVPYPLFAFAGLMPWTFFAAGTVNAMHSLIGNANLITKIYFPRMFIPAASIIAGLLDFAITCVVLAGFFIYYRVAPTPLMLLAPVFVLLLVLLALAAGLVVSALTVRFRDLRYAVPFGLQVMMLASPVIYPADFLVGKSRLLLYVNPVGGIIECLRATLLGAALDPYLIFTSTLLTLIFVVLAIYIFRRLEETFADLI